MKPITAIIVVNNEEKILKRCLESIKPVSSEIIVIHDGKCVDNSLKIASEFTNKVFERKKYYCPEPHLVDALYMAHNDWILRLDTDEYLSEDLIKHILELDLENSDYTHFRANWREWENENMVSQSSYPQKIILFNRNHSLSIGMPHRAVEVSGTALLLNGHLEHTPKHIDYGFKELVLKKLKPFAKVDAGLRYLKPFKIYSLNSETELPKKIVLRNKYPLLTMPIFAMRIYFKTLWEAIKTKDKFGFKRNIQFAHAHLVEQVLLSYYMYQEKKRLKSAPAVDVKGDEIDRHYDEEYYERGLAGGKSLYINYRWMPELTIRSVYFMAKDLPIEEGSKILDFGCAKGYSVRAFRFLNFDAYGVDISDYAISKTEKDIIKYCKLIKHVSDLKKVFNFKFDWVIAKDVFEHILEEQLLIVLKELSMITKNAFVVIPLGKDDTSGEFVVPDYNNELTHFTARTDKWWRETFQKNNFLVKKASFSFRFCKHNWTSRWPKGNGFYVLKSKAFKK